MHNNEFYSVYRRIESTHLTCIFRKFYIFCPLVDCCVVSVLTYHTYLVSYLVSCLVCLASTRPLLVQACTSRKIEHVIQFDPSAQLIAVSTNPPCHTAKFLDVPKKRRVHFYMHFRLRCISVQILLWSLQCLFVSA